MPNARVACSLVVLIGMLTTGLPAAAQAPRQTEVHVIFIAAALPGHAADVMANGARRAAADIGVHLDYRALRAADLDRVDLLVDAGVASPPDGLVFATEDSESLPVSIEAAIGAGIPVVSVGPRSDRMPAPGILMHVETDTALAGNEAGRQLAALGVSNALCLRVDVWQKGNVRCSSAAAAFAERGGAMGVLNALDPAGDPSGIRGAVAARLRADPTIDGLLMTDVASTSQALGAVKDAGRLTTMTLATFDLAPDALDALAAGEMAFAVDEQPFLQGYLAVMSLALGIRDGPMHGRGERILVQPVMVTQQDAAWVRQLERKGIR